MGGFCRCFILLFLPFCVKRRWGRGAWGGFLVTLKKVELRSCFSYTVGKNEKAEHKKKKFFFGGIENVFCMF